jgi:hypothetical protein
MTRARVCFCILAAFAAVAASAQSATGGFQFAFPGASGGIQFEARGSGDSARGNVHFSATEDVPNDDVDGAGGTGPASATITLKVSVDCLHLTGNRAAMSGLVTSASLDGYEGKRVILAVADNGEGANAPPDAFTWGIYHDTTPDWVPSDAEVPGDNGALFSWIATDAERPDDVGIPAGASAPQGIDCRTFNFDSYAFQPLDRGSGNIQVRP